MSDAKIIITLVDPSVEQTEYVFDHPQICLVGRESNCDISLPADPAHREVSRHHCLLEIDPPAVRVRDLHSRNGTYVNGERLDAAEPEEFSADAPKGSTTVILKDGDEVRLAKSLLRIRIETEPDRLQAASERQHASGFEPVFWIPGA